MKLVLQVQETQQQLQDLDLAMDLKESRVRKLEYELKLLSGTSFHLCSCAGHQVHELVETNCCILNSQSNTMYHCLLTYHSFIILFFRP